MLHVLHYRLSERPRTSQMTLMPCRHCSEAQQPQQLIETNWLVELGMGVSFYSVGGTWLVELGMKQKCETGV